MRILLLTFVTSLIACASPRNADVTTPPSFSDGKADAPSSASGAAVCLALVVPLVTTDQPRGAACCYDYNCSDDRVCNNYACRDRAPVGGSCTRAAQCGEGLGCAFGHCAPLVTEGDRCDISDACGGDDLICSTDNRCASPSSDGESCTRGDQCQGQRCIANVCTTPFERGAPCSDNVDCRSPLVCINGACETQPASGIACDRGESLPCALAETCWDDVCVNRHVAGEECDDLLDCSSGLVCRSSVCRQP